MRADHIALWLLMLVLLAWIAVEWAMYPEPLLWPQLRIEAGR